MTDDSIDDETRRAILKGVGATLGVAATGVAAGHPTSGDHGNPDHEHVLEDDFQMTNVGYHSLGGVGSESFSGSPDEPHYGGLSELRVKGDIAACGLVSSKEPTVDRGVALIDVSAYTRAQSREELERAEMTVLGFIPNENNLTSVMDVKFSSDGQYLFVAQQPVAGVFAATAGKPPEFRSDGDSLENPDATGLLAVDVSDPGNPEVLGRQEYAFGMHNCYHHRIGGEDYVFGVTGPLGDPSGMYVHRFDRSTGGLELVNFWSLGDGVRSGEVPDPTKITSANEVFGRGENEFYTHDITVIDDPITGDPYAYLANWGQQHDSDSQSRSGARVLDVSDPTDIEQLGRFAMERAHTIEPVRRTVNGKRLFVVGQENPGPDSDTSDVDEKTYGNKPGHTGYYYLVDATGIENRDDNGVFASASFDGQSPSSSDHELAKWVWRTEARYANFTYSAHNIDIIDTELNGTRRLFVTAGHYHAGTRILEIGYPGGPDVSEEDRQGDPYDPIREEHDDGHDHTPISEGGVASGRDGWLLAETGWSRTHFNTPPESKFGSLSAATPYRWCAVEENGVIFSSDISTGVYVMQLDDPAIPIGTRTAIEPEVDLVGDGRVFTSGQTNRITLEVSTDAPAEVRVDLPSSWTPLAGDDHDVQNAGDATTVEFTDPVDGEATRTVFVDVEAGAPGGTQTIGPAAVTADVDAPDDRQVWTNVPETETSVLVAGFGQP